MFGKGGIAGILADREFASGHLFGWLNRKEIPFYIRIKDNSWAKMSGIKFKQVKKLFNHLQPNEKSNFGMSTEIFGQKVYLTGSRSERGELMVVASNDNKRNAINIYLCRWQIETLFFCLKSRGFCFEATHLIDRKRVEKMMALLTVGMCWAHKTGEWLARESSIRVGRHSNGFRRQNSFFRYGLDFIREMILNPFKEGAKFKRCLYALKQPAELVW